MSTKDKENSSTAPRVPKDSPPTNVRYVDLPNGHRVKVIDLTEADGPGMAFILHGQKKPKKS